MIHTYKIFHCEIGADLGKFFSLAGGITRGNSRRSMPPEGSCALPSPHTLMPTWLGIQQCDAFTHAVKFREPLRNSPHWWVIRAVCPGVFRQLKELDKIKNDVPPQ